MMTDYTAIQREASDGVFNEGVPLAMAFVREQQWEKPMSARDALNHGSAFRSLVKPFRGEDGKC